MSAVRGLLAQRHLAILLCAAALLMKLLVPAGYMVGGDRGRPTVELCSGVASRPMAATMPGMRGDAPDHGGSRDHGKAEGPCAFSGLSAPTLGAADPVQVAALVAFILAAGLVPAVLPAPFRRAHLRPPLRGPPAAA